jgi:integrase
MSAPQKVNSKKKPGRKKKTTHSSGMYRKRITLGHSADGKPIVKAVYGKTKEELENKIAALRVERGMGAVVTNDKSTWEYWADTWKGLAYAPMGKSTKDMYNAALKHLAPLNNLKVSKLTSADLNMITAKMYADGLSKRTIKSVISAARQVCKLARKNHAMMLNIAEDVKPEKDAPVKEVAAITPAEEKALWDVRPLPYKGVADKKRAERLPLIKMMALMQLCCGPRREEVVMLRWKNINLKSNTLTIESAYDYKGKKEKGPKSISGYRDIPIPTSYASMLKDWQIKNNAVNQPLQLVFSIDGKVITEHVFSSLMDVLLDAMSNITVCDRISAGRKTKGIKPNVIRKYRFTSHQLRHTFATNAVASGVDVRTVQYLMGHSKPDMTMHYTHFSQSSWDEAREKLNKHIAPPEPAEAK